MRKSDLIYFILFLLFGANAQVNFSWYPVRPGIQYNYKMDSVPVPISNVIKIDSSSLNLPNIYYLNKIVTTCDTCKNSQLANDFYDSTYVLNSQPQFLKHNFIKTGNNGFYFKGAKPIVIFPFSAIGFNWIYDTIQSVTASVFSRGLQAVLGTQDSVCAIKLSTNDTILISKNFGIIQFPFKTTSSHKYKLVGVEGIINAGVKLKRFHDFFNFNAGDALQFSFEDTDFNILPPEFIKGHERWNFLSVSVYPDSVCCSIKKTYYDSLKIGIGNPAITAYINNVNITFTDSLKHMSDLFPLQEIMVNPYFIYNNGIRAIHKIKMDIDNNFRITKSFGENCPNTNLTNGNTGAAVKTNFTNVYLNKNTARVVGRKLTEGLGFTSELYRDYDRVYEKCLIGYIKGTDTSGTLYNGLPVLIKENKLPEKYFIYPVPANNTISITGDLDAETQLKIVNTFGVEIFKETITNEKMFFDINAAQFANGMYFIVICNRNLTSVKKIIIQH